jgi:hypothetical protein
LRQTKGPPRTGPGLTHYNVQKQAPPAHSFVPLLFGPHGPEQGLLHPPQCTGWDWRSVSHPLAVGWPLQLPHPAWQVCLQMPNGQVTAELRGSHSVPQQVPSTQFRERHCAPREHASPMSSHSSHQRESLHHARGSQSLSRAQRHVHSPEVPSHRPGLQARLPPVKRTQLPLPSQ